MELSNTDVGTGRAPEQHLRLYNQFMENGWDATCHLFGRESVSGNYIDTIFRVSTEMPGVLGMLQRSELEKFSITCYPHYRGEGDYVEAYMKCVRDVENGFRLSEIELSNRYKKLQVTIKDRDYFPEKESLVKRFFQQKQLKKRVMILSPKTTGSLLDKRTENGLEL